MYNSLVRALFILSLYALIIPFAAFAQSDSEITKVGVILPLSGPFARYGKIIQQSVAKFKTDKIQFIYEDEACDPKMAISAHKKLTGQDGVRYLIGPWCGSPQSAVAPLLKQNDQLAILGSSAPASVWNQSGQRMFSTQHSIEEESTWLSAQMNSMNLKKVVVIFKENQFSRAHEAAFRAHFAGQIVETYAYNSGDISELKTIALKVRQISPDSLYVPDAFPLMAGLMKELRTVGVISIPIFSVYSAQSEDVLQILGKDGERLIYSYPKIEDGRIALGYFPTLAAEALLKAIAACGQNVSCSKDFLLKNYAFNDEGVLKGEFVLKSIRAGRFIELPGKDLKKLVSE